MVKVMSNSYGHYPLYLLTAALFIGSILGLSMGLERWTGLAYLGRHSLIVLMFHKFPILLVETVLPEVKPAIYSGHWTACLYVPGLTALSIAACLVLGRTLRWLERALHLKMYPLNPGGNS